MARREKLEVLTPVRRGEGHCKQNRAEVPRLPGQLISTNPNKKPQEAAAVFTVEPQ